MTRMCSTVLATAIGICVAMSPLAAESIKETSPGFVRPLQIEDAMGAIDLHFDSDLGALSPDGDLMAYTVCDPSRAVGANDGRGRFTPASAWHTLGCDVGIVSISAESTRHITSNQGGNWAPVWSPDGQSLAFISDRDGAPRVWVWSRADGAVCQVSEVIVRTMTGQQLPLWTPDGRNILISLLPAGMSLESLDEADAAEAGSPASETTLTMYRSGPDESARAPDRAAAAQRPRWSLSDLGLIDVRTGSVRRIVSGVYLFPWYRLSPNGRMAAYFEYSGEPKSAPASLYDPINLNVVTLAGGSSRVLARKVYRGFGGASWSPDSRYIAYTSGTEVLESDSGTDILTAGLLSTDGGDLYVVSVSDGKVKRMGGVPRGSLRFNVVDPLWNEASSHVVAVGQEKIYRGSVKTGKLTEVTSPVRVTDILRGASGNTYWSINHGKSLVARLAAERETLERGFVRIDLESGRAKTLLRARKLYGGLSNSPIVSKSGHTVVFRSESMPEPPELWVSDADFRSTRRLTTLNPKLYSYTFGASRVIDFLSDDGEPLKAVLLLPAGYEPGRRYPTIVWTYPGEEELQHANRFGMLGNEQYNMHMLTTRGYAVLWPQAPIQLGTPMLDLMKSAMPAINKVIELGITDPDKLAAMGQSGGGYSTLALIAQTRRFKAAVMNAGFGDYTAFYGHMAADGTGTWHNWIESNRKRSGLGAAPWEEPLRFVQNSPIYYLDRITTPLIIQAGGADDGIVSFSDQVFVGLKRLGKDVTYLRYGGEGHGLAQLPNLKDYWSRVIEFLDQHLKGAEKSRTVLN